LFVQHKKIPKGLTLSKIKFGHNEEQFTQGRVPAHAKQWPTPPSKQCFQLRKIPISDEGTLMLIGFDEPINNIWINN